MSSSLWKGFLIGLWLSMSFGPVFFMLIQTSIQKGIRQALFFDFGVLLSDLFYIIIAFFGAAIILDNPAYRFWIALIGGIVLVVFGLLPFIRKSPEPLIVSEQTTKQIGGKGLSSLVVKGFVVNFLNPAVLIIWFGAAASAFTDSGGSRMPVIIYFATILITYFSIDILKIYLATQLKRFLKPGALRLIQQIAGLIILVFGVYLIVNAV